MPEPERCWGSRPVLSLISKNEQCDLSEKVVTQLVYMKVSSTNSERKSMLFWLCTQQEQSKD